MKLSLLLAAGLVGFAAPAFAQNFTIPAGDTGFAAAAPQYDRAADLTAIAPVAAYHGRSVAISHSHGLKAAPRGE